MTGNRNNPAGRLRYWVDQFDTFPQPDKAIVEVAALLLDVDPVTVEGQVAFMRIGSAMADLCREVRVEVGLLPEALHASMFLADFDQVERYVARLADARQMPLHQLGPLLEPVARRGLEYLDQYLSAYRPQPWIGDEERATLLAQVRAVREAVALDATLSDGDKDFVILRLNEVLDALYNVNLTGTRAVERANDALIGSFHRQPSRWQRIWEGALADAVGGLVVAIVLALGQQPQDNMLPPPAPVIQIENNTTVVVDVEAPDPEAEADEQQVVDAEIVEDQDPPGR